jgi:uncharacterized protein YbjT (DUF2867 family)
MDHLAGARFSGPMSQDHRTTSTTTGTGPILVTGGTGTTGRRVAARLLAAGHDVRIGSRHGRPPFDWHDRGTWPAILDGVSAAYLAYAPDLAFPGAADVVGEFAASAVDRGVGRLVLLSGRGEVGAAAAEARVRDAGAAWTVVRAAMFAQNFTEGAFAEQVAAGAVALHVDDVAEPFVDVDDIAEIAAAALTDERHAGQVYEVTGPRLLTFAEALERIGAAIGRPVAYVRIGAGELVDGLVAAGFPPDDAGHLVALFSEILDGRNSSVTDGVSRALGRPARDFDDVVAAAAAAGTWIAGAA